MEYINAKSENIEEIYQLVKDTVRTVYPKYYPQEVVDFFCQWHSKENIRKDIEKCHMYENRGYITQKHERKNVENGVVLVYEVMRKELNTANNCAFAG